MLVIIVILLWENKFKQMKSINLTQKLPTEINHRVYNFLLFRKRVDSVEGLGPSVCLYIIEKPSDFNPTFYRLFLIISSQLV